MFLPKITVPIANGSQIKRTGLVMPKATQGSFMAYKQNLY